MCFVGYNFKGMYLSRLLFDFKMSPNNGFGSLMPFSPIDFFDTPYYIVHVP